MIDGIKIDVLPCNGCKWFDNKLLDFYTYTNTSTGELLDNTLVAKYQGLKFYIIKSIKYDNCKYYSVRGSLHKYFNNGKHNANDFSFKNLQSVIIDLHQKFNIDPITSTLRNVEFGVNINTPVPVKEVLKNLVSYGCYTFGSLKIEGVTVGKKIDKQKSSIKIYDKGKQYKIESYNLARFEVAVRKMMFLKPYSINKLSDLQNIKKVEPLGQLLSTYWQDVIYYDKVVNWKQLTEFERKKLLYYATPRNWTEFDTKQRYRAKKHFALLMKQFSTSITHKTIGNLIGEKWKQLTAKICPRLTHDFKANSKNEMSTNEPLEYTGQTWTFQPLKKEIEFCRKFPKKKGSFSSPKNKAKSRTKKCRVCKIDISHKRSDAKYCTKKCNNVLNGKKRTKRNQRQKAIEIHNLKRVISVLPKNRLWLLISYHTNTGNYTDFLHQSEIRTPKNWIKKIFQVQIKNYRKNIDLLILKGYRAKKLIRIINQSNI